MTDLNSIPAIRKMTEVDLPQVTAIERSTFPAGWSNRQFLEELQNERAVCLVAELNGRVAGYLCLSLLLDVAEIMNFAVDPARQRSGIGSILLDRCMAEAAEHRVKRVQLEVRATSQPAISIYQRYGFQQTGLRKNYYENGVDAVLMDKILGGELDAVQGDGAG